jgi:hypothetical protein
VLTMGRIKHAYRILVQKYFGKVYLEDPEVDG